MIKRAFNILNTFERHLGAFCMGVMIILLALQVISRYAFNQPLTWTEETALVFFVLSVYFGSCAAVMRNQHLRMGLLLSKLGPKGNNVLLIFGNLCFIAFNIVILTGLHAITLRLHSFNVRSAMTGLPRWVVYTVVMFLFVLTSIRLVQDIFAKIKLIKDTHTEQQTIEKTKEW